MTPQDELNAAYEAKLIIENPMYKKAWTDIRDGIIAAMNQSAMADQVTHSRLVMALQIVNKLQDSFKTTIETGQLAEIQLQEKKSWFR